METGNDSRVAIIGDYDENSSAHRNITELFDRHAVHGTWCPTEQVISSGVLDDADGVWVVPGSPYASMRDVLTAIRTVRIDGRPYLGTCGGFQHALLEYARNVLGWAGAEDTQYNPAPELALITPLQCSMAGEQAELIVSPGTVLAGVYGGKPEVIETYHCSYGLNPEFDTGLADSGLRVSARDRQGSMRAIEVPGHRFFVGTLFQPELSCTESWTHPLIEAFLAAVTSTTAHPRNEVPA